MLSDEIEKKIEDAERIINEIENLRRIKSDIEKDFNKLNKELTKDKINEEEYKQRIKSDFKEGKLLRGEKERKN